MAEARQRRSDAESAGDGGWLATLGQRLGKTRARFLEGVARLAPGARKLDEQALDAVETGLLMADVGPTAAARLLERLRARLRDGGGDLRPVLLEELCALLQPVEAAPPGGPGTAGGDDLRLVLLVGVNGSGKTTLAGKLAAYYQQRGARVMLAATDTFRAAAIEQLQRWGERVSVPVLARPAGSDPASVLFDALQAARARGIQLLIADTAGRLHTRADLVNELRKICRIPERFEPAPRVERLMVLDAGIGQNALEQVRGFHAAVGLDGLAINKLDGTARGGVLLALATEFALPVRFLGVGEQLTDLEVFRARDFAAALVEPPEWSDSSRSASTTPAE